MVVDVPVPPVTSELGTVAVKPHVPGAVRVNVTVATCATPSESKIWTDVEKVLPTAAFASRFATVLNWVVATGGRSTPGGMMMSAGWPVVTIWPVSGSIAVYP
jgi:hypothetical protein